MATTYSHIFTSVTDLDLKLKHLGSTERAKIKLSDVVITGNKITATYIYNYGLAGDSATFVATRSYDPVKKKVSCSFKLTSLIRKTVSETGEVVDYPTEHGMFFNWQGIEHLPSLTEFWELTQIAIGTFVNVLSGANGTPVSDPVGVYDRGALGWLSITS